MLGNHQGSSFLQQQGVNLEAHNQALSKDLEMGEYQTPESSFSGPKLEQREATKSIKLEEMEDTKASKSAE